MLSQIDKKNNAKVFELANAAARPIDLVNIIFSTNENSEFGWEIPLGFGMAELNATHAESIGAIHLL